MRTYTEGDGLPSPSVYSMAQDHRGRLWFATRVGIASYDGKIWKLFPNTQSIPVSNAQNIRVDSRGALWVATNDHNLKVSQLIQNQWVSVTKLEVPHRGPFYFETFVENGQTVLAAGFPQDGVYVFRDAQWRHYQQKDDLPSDNIRGLAVFNRQFYVATDRGLAILSENEVDVSANQWLPPERRDLAGIAIESDKVGETPTIWLAGINWVGRLRQDFQTFEGYPEFSNPYVDRGLVLQPDGQGGLFFGKYNQILHYQGKGVIADFAKANGLVSGLTDMMYDREGNLWITGPRGVNKISSMRFANYTQSHGLLENEVSALLEWRPGLWLFGHNGGFTLFDGNAFRRMPLPATGLTRVMDLRAGENGQVWAALSESGLANLNLNMDLTFYRPDPPAQVYTVYADKRTGMVWAGTSNGLYHLENGQLVHVVTGFSTTSIRRIIPRAQGGFYCATASDGIWMYDGQWHSFLADKIQDNYTFSLWEEGSLILVGSSAGLLQLKDGRLKPYDVSGFQIERPVFFLAKDRRGRLWCGTDNGVIRIDGDQVRHYSIKDGLAGRETNRAAGLVDHLGRVWIGTDRGVSIYHEQHDREAPPPLVEVNGIDVAGNIHSALHPTELKHHQNDLVFHFKALSFVDETAVRYRVMLEGYDSDWLPELGFEQRQMRYTNLNPGNYRFRVQAKNALSDWSETVSSSLIRIGKPFWAQWWFLGVMALASLVFLYAIFDYVSSKRYSRYLEDQVQKRTRELNGKVSEHERAEEKIQCLNEELEQRIEARTAELEAAQKDLIENAHYAGMAEIATSMLHNVGNILNSISTSGYLIQKSLETSKIHGFFKANHLLESQLGNLETFFLEDPKGKQLLHFYLSLDKLLRQENQQLEQNVTLMLDKIDIIKNVVLAQNNYASGVFQTETLDLSELVDASLNIMGASFTGKGIIIEKTFDPIPKMNLQKTKVIHILVNLLKNAKESMLLNRSNPKKLTISIMEREGAVFLRIEDNGCGIPKENLHKIFNHGFTTKEDGHGFGLHSCANAMKEMGGAIWAESQGLGKGAAMTLRFPLANPVPVS